MFRPTMLAAGIAAQSWHFVFGSVYFKRIHGANSFGIWLRNAERKIQSMRQTFIYKLTIF